LNDGDNVGLLSAPNMVSVTVQGQLKDTAKAKQLLKIFLEGNGVFDFLIG